MVSIELIACNTRKKVTAYLGSKLLGELLVFEGTRTRETRA